MVGVLYNVLGFFETTGIVGTVYFHNPQRASTHSSPAAPGVILQYGAMAMVSSVDQFAL